LCPPGRSVPGGVVPAGIIVHQPEVIHVGVLAGVRIPRGEVPPGEAHFAPGLVVQFGHLGSAGADGEGGGVEELR